ncbi:leucyl/phenylalanyl-tRNA--protein transferase [Nonomuraea solani]|uniref:Leucyl/phenylalanyl-tRNA--protein transferase n=1 Tax=Nonomuraea solani TaxID=1144553 RepID=A0A1H5Y3Q0_9ACTN|nr:leucyl/phenylalanyl-tRNA--protein transferase [Nonomuraea solani]SEG18518.1 leucyl/phenylalanyl-tRNA--protein transferase [Nonomuraea solani]
MTVLTAPSFTDPWTDVELGTCLGTPLAVGGELTPETLLGAYRRGIFCQPRSDRDIIARNEATYAPDVKAGHIPVLPGPGNPYATLWWSPASRYAIPVREINVSRSLRRQMRESGWTSTVNADFDGVIAGCRTDREPRWITDELVEALRALHNDGWIRTVEIWHGETLVGGLYGCAMGSVFTMDSAFHTMSGAAKTAIADLADRVAPSGAELLDAQVRTEYTVQMGSRALPRDTYLDCLRRGAYEQGEMTMERRPVHFLGLPRQSR